MSGMIENQFRNQLRTVAIAWVATVMTSSVVAAHAAEVEFTATVDRTSIADDETVSLKLNIQSESGVTLEKHQVSAPDFDLVNEYTSNYVESYYINGNFGTRTKQTITQVLRPKRQGTFTIGGIQARVGGKFYSAPSIQIEVGSGGGGTPPPPGYGGGGSGLRGASKQARTSAFFIRAEIDKQKVYKGEQIVVSYYLYQRARTFNIQVDKYPVLNGFLREDLEMPIIQQRLDPEPTVLDGVSYQRALLVRYAAYPLKEGKLPIDSMTVKANYYGPPTGDEEDPLSQFFQQIAPRAAVSKSDILNVEVLPLPKEGRPANYSGGVGQFNISAVADKGELRANETVTLSVKVEGRGNLSAIAEPGLNLPEGVEVYETKTQSKGGHAGLGERVFDYLLIPRKPGPLTLPPIEMSFFDPAKREYVVQKTEPIQLNVLEGEGGGDTPPSRANPLGQQKSNTSPAAKVPQLQPLKEGQSHSSAAIWRQIRRFTPWIYGVGSLLILLIASAMGIDIYRRRRLSSQTDNPLHRIKSRGKDWQKLHESAAQAKGSMSFKQVIDTYELLSGIIHDDLDAVFAIGSRGLSRNELEEVLVRTKGIDADLWAKISELLEFSETVRYASAAGAVSEAKARDELVNWVTEGKAIENQLLRIAK